MVDPGVLITAIKRPPFIGFATINNLQGSWPTDNKPVLQHMQGKKHQIDWFGQAQLNTGGPQIKIERIEPNADKGMLTHGWIINDPRFPVQLLRDGPSVDWLGVAQVRPEGEYPVRPMVSIDPGDRWSHLQAQAVGNRI